MQSFKTKGFLRSYRIYTPPTDLDHRFKSCVSSVLENEVKMNDLDQMELADKATKFRVLVALDKEFSHSVHSSRLHLMTNLANVYQYYISPISSQTPYDKLHEDSQEGLLPDNLVIQLDHVRFTGKGTHPLDQVSPWPRRENVSTTGTYRVEKKEHSRYQQEDYE